MLNLRSANKYPGKFPCSEKQTGQTSKYIWLKRKLKSKIISNKKVSKKSGTLLNCSLKRYFSVCTHKENWFKEKFTLDHTAYQKKKKKRYSLFQKQKKGRSKERHHFKQVKHLVQSKIRQAYNNNYYLQNI